MHSVTGFALLAPAAFATLASCSSSNSSNAGSQSYGDTQETTLDGSPDGPSSGSESGLQGSWLVLFGGMSPSAAFNDTWTWDGTAWTQQTVSAPGTRYDAASARFGSTALLFGGDGDDVDDGRTTLNDFWSWNGQSWTQINATNGPEELAGATGVSCNGAFVLFGGYDQTGNNRYDTWSWDGTSWTEFPTTAPDDFAPTTGPKNPLGTMAASLNGTCYLLDVDASLYTWTGSSWATVDQGNATPPARASGSFAAQGNTLVLYGGYVADGSLTLLADTWTWDGAHWTQRNVSGPGPRGGAAIASFGDTAVLYGGSTPDEEGGTVTKGDTWVWDGTQWTQKAVAGPPPRLYPFMVGQ